MAIQCVNAMKHHTMCECMYHYTVQEEQLRVALMDYLQTHHHNDHEKMQMVALKLGMFYELVNTRQEQAKRDLRRIKPKHLGTLFTHLHFFLDYLLGTCFILYGREM